jgi:hypothetical protein
MSVRTVDSTTQQGQRSPQHSSAASVHVTNGLVPSLRHVFVAQLSISAPFLYPGEAVGPVPVIADIDV